MKIGKEADANNPPGWFTTLEGYQKFIIAASFSPFLNEVSFVLLDQMGDTQDVLPVTPTTLGDPTAELSTVHNMQFSVASKKLVCLAAFLFNHLAVLMVNTGRQPTLTLLAAVLSTEGSVNWALHALPHRPGQFLIGHNCLHPTWVKVQF